MKIRVYQVVGRFKKNGDPAQSGKERGDRTTDDGWRVDWPKGVDPAIPYWDNLPPDLPLSKPWIDGSKGNGTLNDPPQITREFEQFIAHSCFVGEKDDGTSIELGCVKWGFKLEDKGYRGTNPKPAKFSMIEPTFSCEVPKEVSDAENKWNDEFPDFKLPDAVPQ